MAREPGFAIGMPRAHSGHSSLLQVGKSIDNRHWNGIFPKGAAIPDRLTMDAMPTTRAPRSSRIAATSRVLFPVVTSVVVTGV